MSSSAAARQPRLGAAFRSEAAPSSGAKSRASSGANSGANSRQGLGITEPPDVLDPAGPLLTIRRATESGEEITPLIRLAPRDRVKGGQAATRPADVIGLQEAEERRRLAEERRQVAAVSASMTRAIMEVLSGTRQIGQLVRWLDPLSLERVQLRSAMVRRARERHKARPAAAVHRLHRNPQIRSVHLCRVCGGIYEVSLVVIEASRTRAVALRLECQRELWKITALEIG